MKHQVWMPGLVAAALVAVAFGCGDDDEGGTPAAQGGSGGTAGASGQAGTAGDAGQGGTAGDAATSRKLVLLYTSDEHSDLLGFSPERDDYPIPTQPGSGAIVGGIARRATLLAEMRAEADAAGIPTMTVSAGDNSMGTLTQIVHDTASLEWRLMHRLGYDMTTLGNHDFDLRLPSLAAALTVAKTAGELPGIVATNIHFSDASADDDELAALYATEPSADAAFHAYRIVEADNGLRVGFVGWVGVDASFKAPFKAPVAFSEAAVEPDEAEDPAKVLPHLYADLQPVVDKLRDEENVDLVIGLAHGGLSEDDEASEDDKVAANVAGIDIIISGHAHEAGEAPVVVANPDYGKDVVILNGGSNGMFVGRIELTIPGDGSAAITYDSATQGLTPVADSIVPDAQFAPMVDEAIETIESTGDIDGQTALEHLINQSLGTAVQNDAGTRATSTSTSWQRRTSICREHGHSRT